MTVVEKDKQSDEGGGDLKTDAPCYALEHFALRICRYVSVRP